MYYNLPLSQCGEGLERGGSGVSEGGKGDVCDTVNKKTNVKKIKSTNTLIDFLFQKLSEMQEDID